MANFVARWFTPTKSDQSGMIEPEAPKPEALKKEKEEKKLSARTLTRFAGISALGAQTKREEAAIAKKTLLGQ